MNEYMENFSWHPELERQNNPLAQSVGCCPLAQLVGCCPLTQPVGCCPLALPVGCCLLVQQAAPKNLKSYR